MNTSSADRAQRWFWGVNREPEARRGAFWEIGKVWLLYIVIGIIIGFLLGWFYIARQHTEILAENDGHWQGRLNAAHKELKSATEDNQEIKDRLLALQYEHQSCESRIAEAEERAAGAVGRAEAAEEQARDGAKACEELRREADHAKTALANEKARMAEVRSQLERLEEMGRAPSTGREQSIDITMPTPSLALHEAAATFENDAAKATKLGLTGTSGSTGARRRLRTLDARIAQLPAGSSARQRLGAGPLAPPQHRRGRRSPG